jgi:hypothetical protein
MKEPVVTVNSRIERIYNQVELIRGVGDRRPEQLCIMSFVALLAGEDHSDDPVTASRLVRWFAMTINDEMPTSLRQNLKCFAPQMIGTRDGHDDVRAMLLLDAARKELLPRIEADFGGANLAIPDGEQKPAARPWLAAYHSVKSYAANSTVLLDARAREDMTCMVACLVCRCAQTAEVADQRAWYWAKGVDLLDRLCTIGIADARPMVSEEQLDLLTGFLSKRRQLLARRTRAVRVLMRVCGLIPALA